MTKAALFTKAITKLPVGLCANKHEDEMDISIRAKRNIDINLNQILREITPKYDGSGGGHAHAAGASIPLKNFSRFLDEFVDEASAKLGNYSPPR